MLFFRKRSRLILFLVLGLFLGVAADVRGAGAVPTEGISRAVSELGAADFSVREAAFRRLLDWGVEDPEGIFELLPVASEEPEIQNACDRLRLRIPTERLRREALSGPEDPEITGPSGKTFLQAVDDLFDAPTPQKLALLWGWKKTHKPKLVLLARAFLRDADQRTRWSALSLAIDLQEPSLAPDMIPFLRDGEPFIRWRTFQALERWKHRAVREALPAFLADEGVVEDGTKIRKLAVGAALRVEAQEEARRLVAARIDDETDPYVLMEMLDALWGSASFRPEKLRSLSRLLNGPKKGIQEWAACRILAMAEEPFVDPAAIEGELAEGDSNVPAARAWMERHKSDPAFRQAGGRALPLSAGEELDGHLRR